MFTLTRKELQDTLWAAYADHMGDDEDELEEDDLEFVLSYAELVEYTDRLFENMSDEFEQRTDGNIKVLLHFEYYSNPPEDLKDAVEAITPLFSPLDYGIFLTACYHMDWDVIYMKSEEMYNILMEKEERRTFGSTLGARLKTRLEYKALNLFDRLMNFYRYKDVNTEYTIF